MPAVSRLTRGRPLPLLTLLGLAFALLAAPVHAAPLGLQAGDIVTTIEWDALNGGMYTVSSNIFDINGQVTSTVVVGPTTYTNSNTSLSTQLSLTSETLNINAPFVGVDVQFGSTGLLPDLVIKENGINILLANFSTAVVASGTINTLSPNAVFTAIGAVTVIGGDAALVAALGGAGGQANLLLTASIFDFNPDAATLIASGSIFDSNFNVSLSGTLIPLAPAPFVPEPSTALLVGGGLIGMLGMARRTRARRS